MHTYRYRHILAVLAFFLIGAAGLLWAWNTLAELAAWPQAEFRHVLAALAGLTITRILLTPHRGGRHGRDCRAVLRQPQP